MCGIVMVFSTSHGGMTAKNQKVFEDTMFMNALRGMDSTGVFTFDKTKGDSAMIVKDAYPSPFFLSTKDYEKLESHVFYESRAMVGHCRAATRGTVSDATAHPYHHGKIILVHNGTLPSHFNLTKEHYAIDSEAICAALDDKPWEEVLPEVHGAFMLVWYDLGRKVLCLASNGERPFFLATSKSGDLYGASEYHMLAAACARQKEELSVDDKGYSFVAFPKNTVLEIPFDYKGNITDLDYKTFKENKKSFTQGQGTSSTQGTGNIKLLTQEKKKEKPRVVAGIKGEVSNLPAAVWFEIERIENTSTKHPTQRIFGSGTTPAGIDYCVCTLCKPQTDYRVGDFVEATPYMGYTEGKQEFILKEGVQHYMCGIQTYLLLGEPDEQVTDLDGNHVTKEEWSNRPDQDCRCSYCNAKLSYLDLQYAVTHRTNNHIDTVICGNCIDASIN